MGPILTLDGVCKSYGALTVADGIGFSVRRGQALGIIGPNGAGKSTLFNLITGNVPPSKGTIHFLGQDVTNRSPMHRVRMGIGRSFQVPQPFGAMTVFENLLTAAAFGRGLSEAAVRDDCIAILHETGLWRRRNSEAEGLTLLERKRLELARAMATDPELLLLDEIAGGLTEAECAVLVETIRALHARGVTIIWIEHVLHALTSVVDTLLVLNFGKVLGNGPPAEIMASREVREIYLGIEV